VTALIGQHLAQVEQRVAELTAARAELAGLQRTAAATDPGDYASLEICSILASSQPPAGGS
jgi:hypothetical protein